jgi:hypothetical protein
LKSDVARIATISVERPPPSLPELPERHSEPHHMMDQKPGAKKL